MPYDYRDFQPAARASAAPLGQPIMRAGGPAAPAAPDAAAWSLPPMNLGLLSSLFDPFKSMLPFTAVPTETRKKGDKEKGTYMTPGAMEAQREAAKRIAAAYTPTYGYKGAKAVNAATAAMSGFTPAYLERRRMEQEQENQRLYSEGVKSYMADPKNSAALAESNHPDLQRLAVADQQQRQLLQYQQDLAMAKQAKEMELFRQALRQAQGVQGDQGGGEVQPPAQLPSEPPPSAGMPALSQVPSGITQSPPIPPPAAPPPALPPPQAQAAPGAVRPPPVAAPAPARAAAPPGTIAPPPRIAAQPLSPSEEALYTTMWLGDKDAASKALLERLNPSNAFNKQYYDKMAEGTAKQEIKGQPPPPGVVNKITGGLHELASLAPRYGGDQGVFGQAIGSFQGDEDWKSPWSWTLAPLSRMYGSLMTLGEAANPAEARRAIDGATEALASTVKDVVRGAGEGTWTDDDQKRLLSIIGNLKLANDVPQYMRELENVRRRLNANYGINIPPFQAQAQGQGQAQPDLQRFRPSDVGIPDEIAAGMRDGQIITSPTLKKSYQKIGDAVVEYVSEFAPRDASQLPYGQGPNPYGNVQTGVFDRLKKPNLMGWGPNR